MSHVERNRAVWTEFAPEFAEWAPRAWAGEFEWGIWHVPESELRALPDVTGMDTAELGCGTGYISAWLARLGARPVGIDITTAQLETARRMQAEFGLDFPLLEASAEDVPLPDASFDLAISEYGASIWADPYRWIPEASRLLRAEGRLVFLRNSPLSMLCMKLDGVDECLQRPQRELSRIEWPDTGEVEFHPGHGELIDILIGAGFEIERLIELFAPEDAETHRFYDYVPAEWAQKWPAEEIWAARKRS
jgi:SAM-dependent methyltransferase